MVNLVLVRFDDGNVVILFCKEPGELKTVVARLAGEVSTPEAREFAEFILAPSKRGCGAFAPRDTRE